MQAKEFPDDIPEGRLKGAFESAINSIPKKDLRKELKHDLEKYFTKLQKMMKAHGKLVTRKNKSVARGTLDDELVQSERRGGIEMGEIKDKSSEKTVQFQWLTKVKCLLKRPGTYDTIRETLQTLSDESEADVTQCLEKEKPNRAKKLALEIKNIVSACYLKLQMNNIQHTGTYVHHLLSALLSLYLDLSSIYCIKKVEKKKSYGKEIGSYIRYILKEKPELLLEVVLQSTYIPKPSIKFLNPFIKHCILDQPAHESHQHYLKHVLVIQRVRKKFDDTEAAELVLHGEKLKPLDGFYRWLKVKCPRALEIITLKKKKTVKAKLSAYIILKCKKEVISLLQESLYADDNVSFDEVENTELTGPLNEEEVSDVQMKQSDALFFIDKSTSATKEVSKQTKKQKEMQKKISVKHTATSKEASSEPTNSEQAKEKSVVKTGTNKTSNAGEWIESSSKETSIISSETVIELDSEMGENSDEETDKRTCPDSYKEKVIETSPDKYMEKVVETISDSDENEVVEMSADRAEQPMADVEKDEVESMDTEGNEVVVVTDSVESGSQNSPVNLDTETDVSLKSDNIEQKTRKGSVADNVFFSESDPDTSIDLQVKSVVLKVIRGSSGERMVESHQEDSPKHSKMVKSSKAKSVGQSVDLSMNSDTEEVTSKEKKRKNSSIGTPASTIKRKKTLEVGENITEDMEIDKERRLSDKDKNQQGNKAKANLASPGEKRANADVIVISEMADEVKDSETVYNATGLTPSTKKRRSHSKDLSSDTEKLLSSTDRIQHGSRNKANHTSPVKKTNINISEVSKMEDEHETEDSGTQDKDTNNPTPKKKRHSHPKEEKDATINPSRNEEDSVNEGDLTTPSKLHNSPSKEAKKSSVKKKSKSTPSSHKKGVQLNDDFDDNNQSRHKLGNDLEVHEEDGISPKEKNSEQSSIMEFLQISSSEKKNENSSNSEKENETPKRTKTNSRKCKTPSTERKEVDKGCHSSDPKKRILVASDAEAGEMLVSVENKELEVEATTELIADEGKDSFSPRKETRKGLSKNICLEDESIVIDSDEGVVDASGEQKKSLSDIVELEINEEVNGKIDNATDMHHIDCTESVDQEKTTEFEGTCSFEGGSSLETDSLRNKSIVIPSDDSESESMDIPNLEKHLKPEIFIAKKLTPASISTDYFAIDNSEEVELDDIAVSMIHDAEDEIESVKANDTINIDEDDESSIDNNSRTPEMLSPKLRSHSKTITGKIEANIKDTDKVLSNIESINDYEKPSQESGGTEMPSPGKRGQEQDEALSEGKITRNVKFSSPTKGMAGNTADLGDKSPTMKGRELRSPSHKSPKMDASHEDDTNKADLDDKSPTRKGRKLRSSTHTSPKMEASHEDAINKALVKGLGKELWKESQLDHVGDEQEDESKPKEQRSVEPIEECEGEAESDEPSGKEPENVEEIRPTRKSSTERKSESHEETDIENITEKQTNQTRSVRNAGAQAENEEHSDSDSDDKSDVEEIRPTRRSLRERKSIAVEETDKESVSEKQTKVTRSRSRKKGGNEAENDKPSDTDDNSHVEENKPTRRSLRERKSVTVEDSDNESVSEKQTKLTRSRSVKKDGTEVPVATSTVRETRRSTRSKSGSDLQTESETGESDTEARHRTRRSVHFRNQMEAIEEQNEKKAEKDQASSQTPVGRQRPRVLSASTSKKEAQKVEAKTTLRKRRLSAEFNETDAAASGPDFKPLKKTTPKKSVSRTNHSPKLKALNRRSSLRRK